MLKETGVLLIVFWGDRLVLILLPDRMEHVSHVSCGGALAPRSRSRLHSVYVAAARGPGSSHGGLCSRRHNEHPGDCPWQRSAGERDRQTGGLDTVEGSFQGEVLPPPPVPCGRAEVCREGLPGARRGGGS